MRVIFNQLKRIEGYKMRFILLAIVMLTSACSTVSNISQSEGAWQVMHAIDVAQTYSGIADPDSCFLEANPLTKSLIGEKPSKQDVVIWGLASSAAHYFLGKIIEKKFKKHKRSIRNLDFGEKLRIISKNHHLGLRLDGPTDYKERRCERRRNDSNVIMRF